MAWQKYPDLILYRIPVGHLPLSSGQDVEFKKSDYKYIWS